MKYKFSEENKFIAKTKLKDTKVSFTNIYK